MKVHCVLKTQAVWPVPVQADSEGVLYWECRKSPLTSHLRDNVRVFDIPFHEAVTCVYVSAGIEGRLKETVYAALNEAIRSRRRMQLLARLRDPGGFDDEALRQARDEWRHI